MHWYIEMSKWLVTKVQTIYDQPLTGVIVPSHLLSLPRKRCAKMWEAPIQILFFGQFTWKFQNSSELVQCIQISSTCWYWSWFGVKKSPLMHCPCAPSKNKCPVNFVKIFPPKQVNSNRMRRRSGRRRHEPRWSWLIKSSWILDKRMIDFGWIVNESNCTYLNLDGAIKFMLWLPPFLFFPTISCVLCHVSLPALELKQNGAVEKWELMETSKHSESRNQGKPRWMKETKPQFSKDKRSNRPLRKPKPRMHCRSIEKIWMAWVLDSP